MFSTIETVGGEDPPLDDLQEDIESAVLFEGVTPLPKHVFNGCSKMSSAKIPKSVTSIGYEAFSCYNLRSITIPDSSEAIGNATFPEGKFASIKIPRSVVSFGRNPFSRCSYLNVNVSVNPNFVLVDRILFNIEMTQIIFVQILNRATSPS